MVKVTDRDASSLRSSGNTRPQLSSPQRSWTWLNGKVKLNLSSDPTAVVLWEIPSLQKALTRDTMPRLARLGFVTWNACSCLENDRRYTTFSPGAILRPSSVLIFCWCIHSFETRMKVQPSNMLELLTCWTLGTLTLGVLLRVGGRESARVLG